MLKRTRALALVAVGAVALSTAVAVSPATAAPRAEDAVETWLTGQLTGGLVHNTQYEFDDYGLTVDVYFALHALKASPDTQDGVISALADNADAYVTGGTPGDIYAGATAKLASAVITSGADPEEFGGRDLVADLESRVSTTGTSAGRATDDATGFDENWNPDPSVRVDYSNTIGQAWVVRTLAASGSALTASAANYLASQQCADGQFRGNLVDPTLPASDCSGSDVRSNDATAFGIEALLAAKHAGVPNLDDDVAEAAAWLRSTQASNGSIVDEGVANANTTGLAALALARAGETAAAQTAARWVATLQVTDANAGAHLASAKGAIAYDGAALTAGRSGGIVVKTRDQWIRATSQAAAALALVKAPTPKIAAVNGFQAAGRPVVVSVTGLEPGWNATAVIAGGASRTLAASASGAASFTLTAPKGTATRIVTVTDSRGVRVGSTSVKVLAAKKLSVATKKKVKRGKVQKVVVKGLAPRESVRVYYRGKVVKRATANGKGAAVVRFKVTKKVGKAKLVVRGAFANRNGVKAFRVVK